MCSLCRNGDSLGHKLDHLGNDFAALDVLLKLLTPSWKVFAVQEAGACFRAGTLQSCLGELTSFDNLI